MLLENFLYLRYVLVDNILDLGGAPVGGGGVVSGQGRPSASQT